MNATTRGNRPSKIGPADYRYLQELVYRQSGIVLDRDKHYLIEARLGPLVRKAGLADVAGLCNLLRAVADGAQTGNIQRGIVNAITTNETFFFREPAQYEALRRTVIPALMSQRRDTRRLRFWSAAASTGQEAYSLAMLLLDLGVEGWKVEIAGTDLNDDVLAKAKLGQYTQIEVDRGLPAGHLARFFTRAGADWQVRDEVRRLVRFEQLDLRQSLRSRGPYDAVLCRNVLIYFDVETKRGILRALRATLPLGGYLALGGAETTVDIGGDFRRVEIVGATFYRAI